MDLTDAADKETKARQRSRKLPVVNHKSQGARSQNMIQIGLDYFKLKTEIDLTIFHFG